MKKKERAEVPLSHLFTSFFKVGIMTFGGGIAMLPMLQKEIVERRGWVSEGDVLDCYAVGQCTPGVIAVNTATMIGYRKRGVIGGIVATFGEILPSLLIITLLSTILRRLEGNIYMERLFSGIRVAVCVLIVQAVIRLYGNSIVDIPTLLLCIATIAGTLLLGLSPVWFVLLGIVYGLGVMAWKRRKRPS